MADNLTVQESDRGAIYADDTYPTEWEQIRLAQSILDSATPTSARRAISEAKAALSGYSIADILSMRETAAFENLVQSGTTINDATALEGSFVYVVRWLDGVVKVGFASKRSRWRKFVCRGARLAQLVQFPDYNSALEAEVSTQRQLANLYPPAFTCWEESQAHLGPGGGGWTECFQTEVTEHAH